MSHRYPTEVFWSDEDEGFIALARDLPGCSAFGETRLEALDELGNAIEAWIVAARGAGNPIPAPSQPSVDSRFSGKVLLRMPKTLHAKLSAEAERENVSLNQLAVFLLTDASAKHEVRKVITDTVGGIVRQMFVANQRSTHQAGTAGLAKMIDVSKNVFSTTTINYRPNPVETLVRLEA